MSDLGETFSAYREAGKVKRAENRENSAAILTERGVAFEAKNGGAHLVVSHGGKVADFWPGTGLYGLRKKRGYRRGVFNLLRELGVKP